MQINYLALLVVTVCAITFYRAGRQERSWALLWSSLSVAASLATLYILKLGLIAVFVAQALLFVGITAYRVWKQEP